MAGTKRGGKKAARKNKQLYGKDFYKNIGAAGGSKSRTGGFYADPFSASLWGRLGGSMSTRGRKLTPRERARKRREFEETYEHLLRIHEEAKRQRVLLQVRG